MAQFGTAYLQIIPTLKGGVKGLERELNGSDLGRKAGEQAGGRLTGALGGVLRTAGGFLLAKGAWAVGEAIGTAITGGINRYMSLENAEAKLKALRVPAQDIEKIMDAAGKSVDGTAFSLDQAVDAAAAFHGANVPMDDMERSLTLLATASSVAGTDMSHMGRIFAKAAGDGRVQGDIIQQLGENGLHVLPMLADHLGVTAEEARQMATDGKISFEDFQAALEKGMDPEGARIMGDTLSGSMANARTAIARFGAEIMDRIGPGIKVALDWIIDGMKWLSSWVDPAFDWVGSKLGPAIEGIKNLFSGGGAKVGADSPLGKGVAAIRGALEKMWAVVGPILAQLAGALREAWDEHGPKVMEAFGHIRDAIGNNMQAVGAIMEKVWSVISWVWERIGTDVLAEVKSIFKFVTSIFSGLAKIVSGIWQTLAGILTGDWTKAKEGLAKITEGLRQVVVAIVTRLKEAFVNQANAMKDLALGAFGRLKDSAVAKVREMRDSVVTWFTSMRDYAVQRAIDIKDRVVQRFVDLKDGVFAKIRDLRQGLQDRLDGMKDGVTNTIQRLVDGAGRVMDGIKSALQRPVDWVIRNVLNPLLGAIKKVLDAVGLGDLAKKIPTILTSTQAAAVAGAKGYMTGGWTGPGPREKVSGFVHADEHVWTKAEMAKFPGGHAAMEYWRKAVLRGDVDPHGPLPRRGYAGGGRVKPVPHGHSGWNGGRYRGGGWHGGVDYASPYGTPIKAAAAGKVTKALALNRSYGHHVMMSHAGGWSTLYAHMSRILTQVGRIVSAGSVIGRVGSTGNSTGPHLHFEARHNGRQVNPDSFLRGASYGAAAGVAGAAGSPILGYGSATATTAAGDLIRAAAKPFLGKKVSGGGFIADFLNAIPQKIVDGVAKKADELLGFKSGGVMPRDGLAWLSEDGRPELVTGPQVGALRGGSTVHSARQTEDMLAAAVIAALASRRWQIDLDNGEIWFDDHMARHSTKEALTLGAHRGMRLS